MNSDGRSCRRTVCVDGTLTLRRCSPVATSPPASCVLSYSRAFARSRSHAPHANAPRPRVTRDRYRSIDRAIDPIDRSRDIDRSRELDRSRSVAMTSWARIRMGGGAENARVLKSLVVNGRTMPHGASGPDTTHECPRVGSDIWYGTRKMSVLHGSRR